MLHVGSGGPGACSKGTGVQLPALLQKIVKKFFKYTPCLDSMLLYELQSSDVFVHAMLEYIQQAGITF